MQVRRLAGPHPTPYLRATARWGPLRDRSQTSLPGLGISTRLKARDLTDRSRSAHYVPLTCGAHLFFRSAGPTLQ
ncbi:hypothetical protein [Oryza sativa Japonica Group]|uniref:Uncharacterized protein n=2 Tax=Oryza sativa subsp. japonica TaxID=39947 RepID=Q5JNP0_ORYSJ|nr:hypothetical protein [Oryza sativa Japonica Group]BAD87820.1 hypothetical protein [Oryza sativa Japonica Group]